MRRRDFLQLSGLAAGGAVTARYLRRGMSEKVYAYAMGLKDYLSSRGVLVGAGFDHRWATNLPLMTRVMQECSIVTPIGEMKWPSFHPQSPDSYDFSNADAFVAVAQSHRLKIHGHTLIGNFYVSDSLKAVINKSNARKYLENFVSTVMGRYRGKIQSWDVVNEVLAQWNNRPDLLSTGVWMDNLGSQYIDEAFAAAASADPNAKLVWNEHHTEHNTPLEQQYRRAAVALMKQLKSRGVPVQVFGIQSHLRAEDPIGGPDFERFLKEMLDLGVEIYITEMDVDDTKLQGSQDQRDAKIAAIYDQYLETVFRIAKPKVVEFWQLSDWNNWIDWSAKSNQKMMRMDGGKHRPAPLDESMQSKPAYNAIVKALQTY